MTHILYSIACRGKTQGKKTICGGWGRWGNPEEKCPTCGEKVVITGTVHVEEL